MLKIVEILTFKEVKNGTLYERLQKGQNPKTHQFIAVLEGVEVGLLIYENWGRTEGFIYEIFVLQANRKCGIGTLILSKAEFIATQLGHTSVRLTARSLFQDELSDEDLIAWYERKGYARSNVERDVLEKSLLRQNKSAANFQHKKSNQSKIYNNEKINTQLNPRNHNDEIMN